MMSEDACYSRSAVTCEQMHRFQCRALPKDVVHPELAKRYAIRTVTKQLSHSIMRVTAAPTATANSQRYTVPYSANRGNKPPENDITQYRPLGVGGKP